MIPESVLDLDAYLRWLEHVAETSGGLPEPHYLIVEELPIVERMGLGFQQDCIIDTHAIAFPSVGKLTYRLLVSELRDHDHSPLGIEQVEYNFHFQTDDAPLVWRYDKHGGHEDDVGLCHVHIGHEDNRKPSGEMDLKMVVDEIARLS